MARKKPSFPGRLCFMPPFPSDQNRKDQRVERNFSFAFYLLLRRSSNSSGWSYSLATSSSSLMGFLPLRKVMSFINRVFFTASHWPPARINIRPGLRTVTVLLVLLWLDNFLLLFAYRIAPWAIYIGTFLLRVGIFHLELIRSLTPLRTRRFGASWELFLLKFRSSRSLLSLPHSHYFLPFQMLGTATLRTHFAVNKNGSETPNWERIWDDNAFGIEIRGCC